MARSLAEKLARHAEVQLPSSLPVANDSRARVQNDVLSKLPLSQIEIDPNQPRKDLGDLTELKASIVASGLIQPIVVSIIGYEKYCILAGERRFTAYRELGMEQIDAIVRSVEEHRRLQMQIIENLHRKDLNPFEEADSYQRLMDLGLTQVQLGEQLGKSQVGISETLKILALPDKIKREYRTSDRISRSMLLEISRQKSEEEKDKLWERAKNGTLTVKEARANKALSVSREKKNSASSKNLSQIIQTSCAIVTVTFHNPTEGKEAVVSALKEALAAKEQEQ